MSIHDINDAPAPQRRPRRRNDDALPVRHDFRSQGRVGVYVFILGAWRIVYSDDSRAKAEEWAHANIRREGSAVSAIEIRERGSETEVLWRAAT